MVLYRQQNVRKFLFGRCPALRFCVCHPLSWTGLTVATAGRFAVRICKSSRPAPKIRTAEILQPNCENSMALFCSETGLQGNSSREDVISGPTSNTHTTPAACGPNDDFGRL
ncbi:hypothetical protein DIPPA_70058 [Diplonema papillatum]|nr:hypothetical protein DIPPA_70058 [Diplonema papillatum]